MKSILSLCFTIFMILSFNANAQNAPRKDVFTKTGEKLNKINTAISVFQPFLLKARQLFYDGKALVDDAKQAGKNLYKETSQPISNGTEETIQQYLPEQSLPVNDPSTINDDGSGNWGNQNNGLYGNCLDILTGTIMGLGEAEESPQTVDLIFVAANSSYQLWTPEYARNQVAAEYTSRSTYESVSKWNEVNETQVAETKLTAGQFDRIQTNGQIVNAVKNAPNYASSLTLFTKLEGKVFAVKVELENRTVYGLIKVLKHYGTEGSNGYLKIQIKSQGMADASGSIDVNDYQRQ